MKTRALNVQLVLSGILAFALIETFLFMFIDRPLAAYTHQLDQTAPQLIDFFRRITDLGKSQWYLPPCGVTVLFCAFLSRGKDVPNAYRRLFGYIGTRALFLFATIALSGLIADAIKPVVGRARPVLWLRDNIYGFTPFTTLGSQWNGMPSGHTTTAFALACSLSIFYKRAAPLWFAYALMLAASRIMVDAHYASDVVAGALLGWLTTKLFQQYGMIHLSKVIFPIDSQRQPD